MSGNSSLFVVDDTTELTNGKHRWLAVAGHLGTESPGGSEVAYIKTYTASQAAGERNIDSATNSYMVTRDECNLTIIGLTTAITIGGGAAGDTHLIGLQISNPLTGTCVITGFADSAGAATSITFPIGSTGYKEFKGAINSAGALTVTCSTPGDDNFVSVLWRPV